MATYSFGMPLLLNELHGFREVTWFSRFSFPSSVSVFSLISSDFEIVQHYRCFQQWRRFYFGRQCSTELSEQLSFFEKFFGLRRTFVEKSSGDQVFAFKMNGKLFYVVYSEMGLDMRVNSKAPKKDIEKVIHCAYVRTLLPVIRRIQRTKKSASRKDS